MGSGGLLEPLEGGLSGRDAVGFLDSFLADGGFGGGVGEEVMWIISAALDVEAMGAVIWGRGADEVTIGTKSSR
jgi:hypothetical protein